MILTWGQSWWCVGRWRWRNKRKVIPTKLAFTFQEVGKCVFSHPCKKKTLSLPNSAAAWGRSRFRSSKDWPPFKRRNRWVENPKIHLPTSDRGGYYLMCVWIKSRGAHRPPAPPHNGFVEKIPSNPWNNHPAMPAVYFQCNLLDLDEGNMWDIGF